MDHGLVIRRHELSDAEWGFVRPLLPHAASGRKRLDDRMVLNGIMWQFRTGSAWRDVPDRYGSWATLHTRFRRWEDDGTFERVLGAPGEGGCGRSRELDGVGRFHRRAGPPARRRGPKEGLRKPGLGRPRGSLIALVVRTVTLGDSRLGSRPLLYLTALQEEGL
ncbi:transposase [Streptomyces sp. NPDC002516]